MGDAIVKRPVRYFLLALATATACLGVARADVRKVCTGEAISSQEISQTSGGAFDSAIGENAEDCLFLADSAVGRQINKTCRIRDVSMSVEPIGNCRIEAMVQKKAIKRIITISTMQATPAPQKAPTGGLCE